MYLSFRNPKYFRECAALAIANDPRRHAASYRLFFRCPNKHNIRRVIRSAEAQYLVGCIRRHRRWAIVSGFVCDPFGYTIAHGILFRFIIRRKNDQKGYQSVFTDGHLSF